MFNGLDGYTIRPVGQRFDLIVHEYDGSWNYGRFDTEREAEVYLFEVKYMAEFEQHSRATH